MNHKTLVLTTTLLSALLTIKNISAEDHTTSTVFEHPKALEGWLLDFQDPFEEIVDLDLQWHEKAWPRVADEDLKDPSPSS